MGWHPGRRNHAASRGEQDIVLYAYVYVYMFFMYKIVLL